MPLQSVRKDKRKGYYSSARRLSLHVHQVINSGLHGEDKTLTPTPRANPGHLQLRFPLKPKHFHGGILGAGKRRDEDNDRGTFAHTLMPLGGIAAATWFRERLWEGVCKTTLVLLGWMALRWYFGGKPGGTRGKICELLLWVMKRKFRWVPPPGVLT